MTDAPFTEMHRETLKRWLRTLPPSRNRTVGMLEEAIDAALAEIDRLDETQDFWQVRAEKAEAIIEAMRSAKVALLHAIEQNREDWYDGLHDMSEAQGEAFSALFNTLD